MWSSGTDGSLVAPGSPVDVPALGISYRVLNIVDTTEPDSPAARAALQKDGKPAEVALLAQGDEIVQAEIIEPEPAEEPAGRRKVGQ